MALIRASCGDCGDVELTTAQVRIQVCSADHTGTYSFRCPTCELLVVKPAERRTIDLLVASGVELAMWDIPAELSEPRGFGEPVDHDELLEFHRSMADEDAFAAAVHRLAQEYR